MPLSSQAWCFGRVCKFEWSEYMYHQSQIYNKPSCSGRVMTKGQSTRQEGKLATNPFFSGVSVLIRVNLACCSQCFGVLLSLALIEQEIHSHGNVCGDLEHVVVGLSLIW